MAIFQAFPMFTAYGFITQTALGIRPFVEVNNLFEKWSEVGIGQQKLVQLSEPVFILITLQDDSLLDTSWDSTRFWHFIENIQGFAVTSCCFFIIFSSVLVNGLFDQIYSNFNIHCHHETSIFFSSKNRKDKCNKKLCNRISEGHNYKLIKYMEIWKTLNGNFGRLSKVTDKIPRIFEIFLGNTDFIWSEWWQSMNKIQQFHSYLKFDFQRHRNTSKLIKQLKEIILPLFQTPQFGFKMRSSAPCRLQTLYNAT